MTETLYKVLKVRKNASDGSIKLAHRKLVKTLHPDIPVTGDAEKFRMVDLAYKVLRDADTRAEYDKTGTYSESAVKSEMDKVLEAMVGIYNNLLGSGLAFDERNSVIDMMKTAVSEALEKMAASATEVESAIAGLRGVRKTLSREGEGENLFVKTTDWHIDSKTTILSGIQQQIRIFELVQEELGNYSSFARVTQAVQIWTIGTTSAA